MSTVFCDVTPRGLVQIHRLRHIIQPSVNVYQIARRHIPEDSSLYGQSVQRLATGWTTEESGFVSR
jgi:hypothetical protein